MPNVAVTHRRRAGFCPSRESLRRWQLGPSGSASGSPKRTKLEKRQLRLRGSRAHRTGAPAHRLNRQKDVCFVDDARAKTTELNVKRLQKRY
jgi:hypothetical protein